jgi:hypothetical protein
MLTSTIIPFRFEPAAACDDVPAPPLNIIILHEDRSGHEAALELLREVLIEKSGESEVRPMAWRFDELRGPLMRARALEAAASGEIFVIAASCARPIPSHVIEWLGEDVGRAVRGTGAVGDGLPPLNFCEEGPRICGCARA